VASIAHTLLSTSPAASPIPRITSSVRSVATPDAFFGHATQRPSAGASSFATDANRFVRSARDVVNRTTTSSGPFGFARISTPSGSAPSVSAKSAGAPGNAQIAPDLIPSFFSPGYGLQVFTMGHLLLCSSAVPDDGTWSFDPLALLPLPAPLDVPSFAEPMASASAGHSTAGTTKSRDTNRGPTTQ